MQGALRFQGKKEKDDWRSPFLRDYGQHTSRHFQHLHFFQEQEQPFHISNYCRQLPAAMIELHRQNSREPQQYHSAVLELTLAREGSSSNEATVCAGGVLVGPQGCIAACTLHTIHTSLLGYASAHLNPPPRPSVAAVEMTEGN